MKVYLPIPGIDEKSGKAYQSYFEIETPSKDDPFVLEDFISEAITIDSNRATPLVLPKYYSRIRAITATNVRVDFVEPSIPIRIAWSEQAEVLPLPYPTICSKRIKWIGRIYYPCVKVAYIKVTRWYSKIINVTTKFRPPAVSVKPPSEWTSYSDATAHALGLLLYPPEKVTLFDLLVLSYYGDAPQRYRCVYREMETVLGVYYHMLVGDYKTLLQLEV